MGQKEISPAARLTRRTAAAPINAVNFIIRKEYTRFRTAFASVKASIHANRARTKADKRSAAMISTNVTIR